MDSVIAQVEAKYKKNKVADVRTGDSVRVHQKVKEGSKERIQVYEGLVIKATRRNSLTSSITVRRVASGVGVEKTYLLHSPAVIKVEVVKRSKVRRNNLSYMRSRAGKSTRLTGIDFDKEAVNVAHDKEAEAEEAKIHEAQLESYDPEVAKAEKAAEKAEDQAKEEAKITESSKSSDEIKNEENPAK